MGTKRAFGLLDMYRFAKLNREINYCTNGWTTAVTGTGAVTQAPSYISAITWADANSSAIARCIMYGCAEAGLYTLFDLRKRCLISFVLTADTSIADSVRYFQFKEATTHGDLGALGLGVKLSNLTLYGESYGSERGEVELLTLSTGRSYKINIEHDPVAGFIKWYVNGVLTATQSTAAKIPNAVTTGACYAVLSCINGATATTCRLIISAIQILRGE